MPRSFTPNVLQDLPFYITRRRSQFSFPPIRLQNPQPAWLTINVVLPPTVRHVQMFLAAEQPEMDSSLRFARVVPLGIGLYPVVGGKCRHQEAHDQAATEKGGKDDPPRLQAHFCRCSSSSSEYQCKVVVRSFVYSRESYFRSCGLHFPTSEGVTVALGIISTATI